MLISITTLSLVACSNDSITPKTPADTVSNISGLLTTTIAVPRNRGVGINEADIPGFQNENGANPTQVTVSYSRNIATARAAGCTITLPDATTIVAPGTSGTSASDDTSGVYIFDSLLGDLNCIAAPVGSGSYTDCKHQLYDWS